MKEELNKKAKKENKAIERWADCIDFNEMFRVKGHHGLYILNSYVNKAGMINLYKFLDRGTSLTVRMDEIECLGKFVFHTTKTKKEKGKRPQPIILTMNDVFNNLHDLQKDSTKPIDEYDVNTIMDTIVPNYDEAMFKDYHAKKVIKWFKEYNKQMDDFGKEAVATLKNKKK